MKGSEKNTADNDDGSRRNPVRSKDEILKLDYAKEVKYVQRNGTPGLTFRRGKTNHSYQWIPAQLLQKLKLSLKSSLLYSFIILSYRPNCGLLPLWRDIKKLFIHYNLIGIAVGHHRYINMVVAILVHNTDTIQRQHRIQTG